MSMCGLIDHAIRAASLSLTRQRKPTTMSGGQETRQFTVYVEEDAHHEGQRARHSSSVMS